MDFAGLLDGKAEAKEKLQHRVKLAGDGLRLPRGSVTLSQRVELARTLARSLEERRCI